MNWTDLTWEALKTWTGLSVLILLVMHLAGKQLLEEIRKVIILWTHGDQQAPWKARGMVINLMSFAIALAAASSHVNGGYSFGNAFVAALIATAAASFGHEVIKNALKLVGQEDRVNDPFLRLPK